MPPSSTRLRCLPVAVCLFLGAMAPPSAQALRMEGYLRSHVYLREERLADPDEEYFLPVRQYMTLHLTEFSQSGWSFHGSGWVRQDLWDQSDYAYYQADDSFESELLTGYLQWQDPRHPNTYARFGRQYVFQGGLYERFDGVSWSKQLDGGHGYSLFGGLPVVSDYGGKSNDRVGGGRAWVRPFLGSEVGLSYVYRTDDSDLDREAFTQDFFWRPLHWVELSEHVTYDTITDDIIDLGLFAGLKLHRNIRFTLSYDETIPGALLPQTSVLSVFSNDEIKETAAGLEFTPDRDWRLWAEAVRYDSDSPGGANPAFHVPGNRYWEYRAGARYYYQDDSSLSLELRHVEPPEQGIAFVEGDDRYESIDNGFDRLRLTDHRYFTTWLWTSWEAAATLYRDSVNGSPRSFSLAQSVGYRPTKRLEAVGTLRYVDSAVDNTEFQVLFSVTYWFDKRMCGGVTQDLIGDNPGYGGRWLPNTDLPVPAFYRPYE